MIRTYDPITEFKEALEHVHKLMERPTMDYDQCVAWVEEEKRLAALPKKKVVGMEDFLKEAESEAR